MIEINLHVLLSCVSVFNDFFMKWHFQVSVILVFFLLHYGIFQYNMTLQTERVRRYNVEFEFTEDTSMGKVCFVYVVTIWEKIFGLAEAYLG